MLAAGHRKALDHRPEESAAPTSWLDSQHLSEVPLSRIPHEVEEQLDDPPSREHRPVLMVVFQCGRCKRGRSVEWSKELLLWKRHAASLSTRRDGRCVCLEARPRSKGPQPVSLDGPLREVDATHVCRR